MTIFISDGENILMDKVTLLEYKQGDWNLKAPESGPLGGHYESKTKFNFLESGERAKCWGADIKFFSGIGALDYTWWDVLKRPAMDVKNVLDTNGFWRFLSKEMRLIILDVNDTLTQVYYCHVDQIWNACETTMDLYNANNVVTVEGYCADEVRHFKAMTGVNLTAIETLVLSQSFTNVLGRRFDHYHIPTGKVTYDLDLSDRQRNKIIQGIEARIKLSRTHESVYLLNTPKGK